MKKGLFIVASILLGIIIGVGATQYTDIFSKKENHVVENSNDTIEDERVDQQSENGVEQENTTITEDESSQSSKANDNNESANKENSGSNSDYDGYEEFNVLEDYIAVDDFTVDVVEDNKEKRVALFSDDSHHKKYKSIYIKHKNWLKIVDLNGGLIYNDRI